MAMHDDDAEIAVEGEERVADPHQVVRVLAFQRDAWANAGVDEQIAAFAVA